ncbi:MAG: hypothetical protein BHW12_07595 [Coprobacillus sp. 28_7]|nr:MAG: hypothetical protein BHW12_07595 [Coprobacillus sp. 28_7]
MLLILMMIKKIQGRSSSGKSTLFKLAYGLIKPTKERATINGIDTYLLKDDIKRKLLELFIKIIIFLEEQ